MRYIDLTCLYPTINYCRGRGFAKDTINDVSKWCYTSCHPVRIRENFENINDYFGFIKCKIAPPKNI